MAPRRNAKKRDARPKRAKQTNAAGHKKEKGPEKQVRVRGCPVTTWALSLQKKNETDVGEKPKEERTTPEKARPDIKRIFQTVSGANREKIKQKHRQKPTKKNKNNTTTQKQKFAPENFFKKQP